MLQGILATIGQSCSPHKHMEDMWRTIAYDLRAKSLVVTCHQSVIEDLEEEVFFWGSFM